MGSWNLCDDFGVSKVGLIKKCCKEQFIPEMSEHMIFLIVFTTVIKCCENADYTRTYEIETTIKKLDIVESGGAELVDKF